MEAARARDEIVARTKVQVIRVGEQDLGAKVLQLLDRHALDGAARADRHERRRLDDAVREGETAAARTAVPRDDLEPERGAHRA